MTPKFSNKWKLAEKNLVLRRTDMVFGATSHSAHDANAIFYYRGFSLVELMVVILIATILMTVAVPNLRSFLAREKLTSASNELYTSLQTARSEAMRRNRSVVIAPIGANTSGNWSGGWHMFVDLNSNGVRDVGEDVLRAGAASERPLTIFGSSNFRNRIVFLPSGALQGGGGHFVLCIDQTLQEGGQSRSRAIIINAAGRVRTGSDNDGNGIPETDAGEITTCTPS